MATTDKYFTYRGDLRAVAVAARAVLFVTAHAEGRATAVFRLDVDKLTLAEDPLPAGGSDVATDGKTAWVAGTDGRVYRGPADGGKLAPLKAEFDVPPTKLVPLPGGRLAVLAGGRVVVLAADGRAEQALDLPELGTALGADPTGNWLVVGTAKGTVLVFDAENRDAFLLAESAKLHEGAVTALLFEPDDLRFLSAGADGKLLSTHARGKLEPEDKGRGNNHADVVTALAWGPGDRLLSGGRDATVKSWPRVGGVKPATTKDGLAKVTAQIVVSGDGPARLVVGCEDNTLRVFPVDAAGKIGELSVRVRGVADWAKHELEAGEVPRREAALRRLAEWDDALSVERLAGQVQADADHWLRLLATQLLAAASHPRAVGLLEKPLKHADEAVRTAAFAGLRRLRGDTDLHVLDLALAAEKPDVGRLAVRAIEGLAAGDDQAMSRLTAAIDRNPAEVRQAALASLEAVHAADGPVASLVGLRSKHADLRRLALVRLYRRGLLADARVQTALRRAADDADPEVRRTAFLLSLHARPALVVALRNRDTDLQRQLVELEAADADAGGKSGDAVKSGDGLVPTKGEAGAKETKGSKKVVKGKLTPASAPATPAVPTGGDSAGALAAADLDPLLQATASRTLDTCLRGARGLAVLGDERALGLLLQLSRESEPAARVEVARGLAALADPRGGGRLRSLLFDADAAVRDAAFTALAALAAAVPAAAASLSAADAGLGAAHEDVRRRGLELVVAAARRRLPQSADDPAWRLLVRALNDGSAPVRSEAFKAALNLGVGGGEANTLRFVLQSVHPDVRREVLTEATAQVPTAGASGIGGKPWAWGLLLDLLNDADPALRGEAFDFAVKKTKDLGPLEAALGSKYPDVRRRAVDGLVKKHTKAAQALLARALADADPTARLAAVDALVGDDVRDALLAALGSPHDDVHARAALALARHGEVAALKPLAELASAPEPQNQGPERTAEWLKLAKAGLDGLGELGDPAALPHVERLLDSPHEKLRKAAGRALAWVALGHHPGSLRQAMQHADPQVKYRAAFGLALGGEASAAPLVFGTDGANVLSAKDRLAAALALGPAGEDQLVAFLDSADERSRTLATLLLMLLELKVSGGVPSRCLACLASREPRVRLRAARGLDTFREPGLFLQFVTRLFTERAVGDRGDEKPWTISPQTVDAVADLVAFGPPAVRARTARVLGRLFGESQGEWDRAWAAHAGRFAADLAAARKEAARRPAPPSQYTPAQLEELAFGAYVGLLRDQGGSGGSGKRAAAATDPQAVTRARQAALTWLAELAKRNPALAGPGRAVFTQALRDPHQPVRTQAFDQLRGLDVDATSLGAEALEAGYTDLGVRGLELLRDAVVGSAGSATTGSLESPAAPPRARSESKAATATPSGNASAGAAVLEQVMLARPDDLSVEAAKLLATSRGTTAVAAAALAAVHEPLRAQAVAWLAAEYDKSSDAAKHLRAALASRYAKVREAAAFELATKKDPAAFDALVALLAAAADEPRQRAVVDALSRLGDSRTPTALLDRLENDPAKTGIAGLLLAAAATFRQPAIANRLLGLMDRNATWRPAAGNALLTMSGHDQPIADPDDERPADRDWERKQFPRHDAVLAALLDKSLALNAVDRLSKLMPAARWSRGKDVDPVLARLASVPDERVRRAAVEAIAWRARKRGGSIEPLRVALAHRDPTTQFLAAEGLAWAGRGDGLSVLLSAVDFLPEVPMRRRAVEAMGALGDVRALDPLLKLATEDGHVLQPAAAEALGRLGQSAAADEVFKLLERLSKSPGSLAADALRGLRWLDTAAAWRLIRQRAESGGPFDRRAAVELLRHDDDPATRDLLLKIISTDQTGVLAVAIASASGLFGDNLLEVHFAFLANPLASHADTDVAVRAVGEQADAARVFEQIDGFGLADQAAVGTLLVARRPLPTAAAVRALSGSGPVAARVAAKVVGYAGPGDPAAAGAGPALAEAFGRWHKLWGELLDRLAARGDGGDEVTHAMGPTLEALLWAAARHNTGQDVAASAATAAAAGTGSPARRPVRLAALAALATYEKPTAAAVAALEAAAVESDPEMRALAADALAARRPDRAAKLAEKVLPDRVSFDRVAGYLRAAGGSGDGITGGGGGNKVSATLGPALRTAIASGHYQGIALPYLLADADVEALSAVVTDRKLPEVTRIGAVEGLGRVGSEPAEAKLRAIGTDAKEDEAVRKAAWRALRRSKRMPKAVAQ
jgi:ParB family chromosome partitioning protein